MIIKSLSYWPQNFGFTQEPDQDGLFYMGLIRFLTYSIFVSWMKLFRLILCHILIWFEKHRICPSDLICMDGWIGVLLCIQTSYFTGLSFVPLVYCLYPSMILDMHFIIWVLSWLKFMCLVWLLTTLLRICAGEGTESKSQYINDIWLLFMIWCW